MGELDLAGFDDCGSDFAEIDTDTLEHVRHSAYWAINTGRSQDWEEPTRWLDIESFVQAFVGAAIAAHVTSVGTDLEEVDPRIVRAVYSADAGEVMRWSAEITTAQGTVFAEGPLQPLPQDAEEETDDTPAFATPVSPGVKTLRQVALQGGSDGALFPHWLTGPNSGKIIYSIGLLLDMATEWLYQGIQQRFPLVADEGALPNNERDNGNLRGLRESTEDYRRRRARWVPTHRRAGTPFAIAEQVQAYFSPQSPTVYIVQHDPTDLTRATWSVRYYGGVETTIVATPSNFDWDSEDTRRPESLDARDPRIWIIVEQPAAGVEGIPGLFASRSAAQATTRDIAAMNGAVRPSGTAAPSDQYRDLVSIARQWRAMGTWIAGVIVCFGEFDPGGSGATHPDGRWFDMLNDAKNGNRIPDNIRLLYVNRYPDEQLPASPAPYTV